MIPDEVMMMKLMKQKIKYQFDIFKSLLGEHSQQRFSIFNGLSTLRYCHSISLSGQRQSAAIKEF